MTKQTQCLDERKISYDDGAQGQDCQLPFFMDGQYYETCTRHNTSVTHLTQEYWCPSKDFVNQTSFVYDSHITKDQDSYGLCPNYLFPPDNGCQDHYDAVSFDILEILI